MTPAAQPEPGQPDSAPTPAPVAPGEAMHVPVLGWYAVHARDLPWRRPGTSPWAVLVSEFMLQQTPVARVLPVWEAWLDRWPTPGDLAAADPGAAVRGWGRLGYPRRALRLHAASVEIVERHGGEVPGDLANLRALPGVGEYTAAAVASFAFRQRHAVLDTNVRRVLARVVSGVELPPASLTRAERLLADGLLPEDPDTAATWGVAVMELGALICKATSPECRRCPIAEACRWNQAGRPGHDGPPRRAQLYAGTDRQCRGRLLGVLRDDDRPVHVSRLEAVWEPAEQRDRCLESLLTDGLVVRLPGARYALP